jgi:hypothetical protein
MAINELIARGGTPVTIENPIKNALAISQLRGEDLKSSEVERSIRNRNLLNDALRANSDASGNVNFDAARSSLTQSGHGDVADALRARQKDQFNDDLAQARGRQELRNQYLAQATTADEIMNWHKANHADSFMSKVLGDAGVTSDQSMARIASLKTPEQIQEFKAQSLLKSGEFFDYLGKQGNLKVAQTNAATSQGQLAVAQGNAAENKRWHDMQDRKDKLTSNAPMSPEVENLVGPALIAGQISPDDINTPVKLKSVVAALRQDPKADIQQQRAQNAADKAQALIRPKLDAAYPRATAAYKKMDDTLTTTLENIKTLKDHEGLSGITGAAFGRFGSVRPASMNAQTYHDNLVSGSAISAITDMRANSPTGAALGNTSDADMKLIKDSASRLSRAQSTEDYKNALDDYAAVVSQVIQRNREQYEETYGYKKEATKGTPTVQSGNSVMDEADKILAGGK